MTTTGGNAGDFTVNTTGMLTSVPATTGSTTFTVTFTPMVASSRTTTLRIVNDDSNENPFDITLTGSGNTAPVFLGITLNTVQGQPVALSEVKMLLRASDADGQAVSITGVGTTSTQGAAISRSGGVITYATPAAYVGADTFTVLLTDGLTSINGTITVNVTADPGLNPNNPPKITVLGGGPVSVGFFGIPGRTYGIQRSTNLTDWTQIGAPTANANGAVTLTDPSPSEPSAFYRVIFPAE